ncbi:uncharacterized protein LOC133901339 [Phragmites australis]|uniref:uncharacterized protein LOC133901339 n=1 Tax=Phragmites australis TaxID=29695 RepID=UPI002D772BAB|nr:uncharacterized protein LOC133901339 [Phragmites australis]
MYWAAAAAAARKLRRIPQSRAPPVSVSDDGLLYRPGFSSYGSAASFRERSLVRRVVSIGAISLAGGLALSAVNDLAIFHGCTTKAIVKATENPKIMEAIGVPIARGPWYDASLAVGQRRRSVSCTFPVSGPHGSGFLQIKAIRNGEDGLLSFLRHHDWEILTMEAHLHVPSDHDKQKTLVKVNLDSCNPPSASGEYEQPESES